MESTGSWTFASRNWPGFLFLQFQLIWLFFLLPESGVITSFRLTLMATFAIVGVHSPKNEHLTAEKKSRRNIPAACGMYVL